MNDQQDPPEQKATEQPQETEAAVHEPEPVAAPKAAEPAAPPEMIEAEAEAPLAEEETEQPETPPGVSAEQAEVPAEDGCPVEMDGFRQCGRPVRHAPSGVDEQPVCLMHSRDPAKSDEEFQKEFERILTEAGDGVADFTGFVFPRAVYQVRQKFAARCIFSGATFTDLADFVGAMFTQGADFSGATFTQVVSFSKATFTKDAEFREATFSDDASFVSVTFAQDADFRGATFTQAAYFNHATFTQGAYFDAATFTQDAKFGRATFTQDASFRTATFTQGADFTRATFTKDARFSEATFTKRAYFVGATFTQAAYFVGATFTQRAYFIEATFTGYADFMGATFTEDARFIGATFAGFTDFRHAVFAGAARFAPLTRSEREEAKPCEFKDRVFFQDARFQDYADFRGPVFGEPGSSTARPVFSLTRFEKPERVTFYKTWLGQTLFVNCDVSKLSFSDVGWGRDGERVRLYEETVPLDDETAEPLRPPVGSRDERRYRLIAETYHQLKNNYDSRGDPWTANEFHYGEMEMRRRSSRWPRVGLTALYKYASQYGLSMARPLAWLAGVLLLFTLLYPLAGLRPVAARTQVTLPVTQVKPITYWNLPEATGWVPRPVRLVGHSFMTTLAVASLQREAAYYEPAYGLGRFLGILELALTSTLAALFILAVRRQFKRGGD
jgi:uncharacterized protein YjbI with pentapeptide repeats